MNGFRQSPGLSKKEKVRNLETEIKNLQMAVRISQMMLQQTMNNMKSMHEDTGRLMGLVTEMQYKLLAVQNVSKLDVTQLNSYANELRLKDFNEASDKEDAEQGFTVGTTVDENSTVILTSKTDGEDKGIFRSRIKLSDCGVPDLIKAFSGREVGARAIVKLNGLDHEVELLAIRQPSVVAENTLSVVESDNNTASNEATSDVVGNA